MAFANELKVARALALKAGSVQLDFLEKNPRIELKKDRSPVTEVDQACENMLRDELLKSFPGDGFLGEETGERKGTNRRRWIVDPLDGTLPYIRGIPTFSVLIALESEGAPVVGVIHLPGMGLTCSASSGSGAFLNNIQVHVSNVADLNRAMGSTLGFVENSEEPEGKSLLALMKQFDYSYGFMDAYTYVCVASGRIDISVNLLDKAWDCAAAACIVKEAGGRYSDIQGNETVHNGSIILSNGLLHNTALEFFVKNA